MNLTQLKKELQIIFGEEEKIKNKTIFDLLKKYNSDDWQKYAIFDEKEYKRNYILKSELFDIIVICWKKGQETKLHNHPEKWCYFKVLKWELQENLYEAKTGNLKITILKKDAIKYEHDSIGIHKVINNSNSEAAWLYIYRSASNYNPYNYEPKRNF